VQPPSSARSRRRSREHLALRVGARVDLEHLAVQELGLADLEVEQPRARLRPDREQVAESARDHQRERRALPLEQRVSGEGRAHPHVARRDRRAFAQRPMVRMTARPPTERSRRGTFATQRCRRIAPGAVGRSAAIDPELPAGAVTIARG
jgi:hypothetical protein